jgi:superfamily II DNA helicase RecQ
VRSIPAGDTGRKSGATPKKCVEKYIRQMQIKIFSIPIIGGEALNEDLNRFLRSKKVLHIDKELVSGSEGTFWSFCVKYIEGESRIKKTSKSQIDYREVLDEPSFERFVALREIRKQVAGENGIPAYLVLTNEELAEMAKIEHLTLQKMKKIKGIGQKKIEKYSTFFLNNPANEKSKSTD